MCQEIFLELVMNERNANHKATSDWKGNQESFFLNSRSESVLSQIMLKQNISIDLMFSIPFLAESGYNVIRIGKFVRKPKQAKLLLALD